MASKLQLYFKLLVCIFMNTLKIISQKLILTYIALYHFMASNTVLKTELYKQRAQKMLPDELESYKIVSL